MVLQKVVGARSVQVQDGFSAVLHVHSLNLAELATDRSQGLQNSVNGAVYSYAYP